jgi:hypothetical protein
MGRCIVVVALAVVVVCGVTGVIIWKRQGAREVAVRDTKAERNVKLESASVEVPHVVMPGPDPVPTTEPSARPKAASKTEKASGRAGAKPPPAVQPSATQPSPGGSAAKEPIQDPLARVALSFVGTDSLAEAYWYAAINNPNLSAHERQDLIEDLNEDGFPDPDNPTLNDLPLILNRLQIIEEVASDAMDKVNADAFDEAYKDLANMFRSLMTGR